ncbi:MAG: chloride channel protein [Microbacter sp.]
MKIFHHPSATMLNNQYWKSIQRFVEVEKRNFSLLFYAFIIGIFAGTVGSLFRLVLMHLDDMRHALYHHQGESVVLNDLLIIGCTVAFVLAAIYLVRRFAPETAGSGVQEIEGALDGSREIRWKRVIPVKFFASMFSLGSGMLLGREGPTIQLGAGIGKMVKEVFHQPDGMANSLISSGAAAGLATAFNAPLSGIVFVIEELHDHFRFSFFRWRPL